MRKLSISAFAVVLVLTPIGASAQQRQANLPDGVGKDLVEGLCTGCHSANQIVRSSGYTEEEWTEHISDMVDLADMPKERSEIARYLDTNAVIALLADNRSFVSRLRAYLPSDFGIPAVVHHELCFSAYNSRRVEANLRNVHALQFEVLPLTMADAERAGEIRATLQARGTPIGPSDVLIAGQAVALS